MPFQHARFEIHRFNDRAVFERVRNALLDEFEIHKCTSHLLFGGAQMEGLPGQNEGLDQVVAEETIAIRQFVFGLKGGGSITIVREWDGQSHTLKGFHDTVTVQPRKEDDNAVPYVRLVKRLREELRAVDDKAFLDYLKEEDRAYYQARERSLRELQQMQEGFFGKLQDFATKQAERYQAKEAQLEEKLKEQECALDQTHRARSEELDEREGALKQRAEAFDDRASMHVRREIRADLKSILAERGQKFELTEGTKRRRWAVFGTYVLLLVAFAVGAVYFIMKESPGSQRFDPLLVVRQVVFTLAFATTAGFFLRWLNRWAHAHAEEEFKLKRLELDIDRASWVVEHALEWKAEKGAEIPQYLLERLSQNLFSEEPSRDSGMSAADSLALAILRSATSTRLKLGAAEFEIDHKGIKKLGKAEIE